MKTRNKKGFTIIELVIVIAVVGVLTAILVPTFINLTNRANEASDNSLVKNLNTAMAMEEGEGKKNNTYHDAIEYLDNYGYKLANLATKAGNDLLWNSKTNRFLLNETSAFNKDQAATGAEDIDYWTIKDSVPDGNKFSIYAGNNWDDNTAVAVSGIGFDAGTHNLPSVTYSNEAGNTKNVTLRTNSAATSLTINDASESTIKHYGAAGALNIIKCHTASYHENGAVAFAEIATGRIVLEKEAKVTQIHLTATGTGSEAYFNNITIAKDTEVEMPKVSRDPVEIPEGGAKIVALQDGTSTEDHKDYVWLTAVGIFEQVTLGDASAAGTNYASASQDETKKEAAKQIANNIVFSDDAGENYRVTATKNGDDWEYAVQTEAGATTSYTASVTDNEVVVKDSTDQPVTTENAGELTPEQKADAKAEVVDEMAAKEIDDENQKGASYVARIGAKGYESFKEAVAAAKEGEKIVVTSSSFTLDSNIGTNNTDGLNNKVYIDADTTITLLNTAKIYMTNNGGFVLNGNKLNLVADSSCDVNGYTGFMNCDLSLEYNGHLEEYCRYTHIDNTATIQVDFNGLEDSGVGFNYSLHNDVSGDKACWPFGLHGGFAGQNDVCADDEYVYDAEQGSYRTVTISLDTHAKVYLPSGAKSYVWKTYTAGSTYNFSTGHYDINYNNPDDETISIIENHNSWVVVNGVSGYAGSCGKTAILVATVTYADDTTETFEWCFNVTTGMGGIEIPDFDDDIFEFGNWA